MKNITVNILNNKLDTVKTYDGFDSYGYAVDFAKNEAKWRGCTVEVVWMDDANNQYSEIFENKPVMLNEKEMTLNLKRIDVCDLLLACTLIAHRTDAKKWNKLHDKLKEMLDEFDKENFTEVEA